MYRWFLLPAGQVCLHPLLCHEVRSRFISWGPLLIHIWSLPSNPATSVVQQHHSGCNSISEWTGWVMLIMISIALCVYPPTSMKPSRPLCIRTFLFRLWTQPSPMISLQAMLELQFVKLLLAIRRLFFFSQRLALRRINLTLSTIDRHSMFTICQDSKWNWLLLLNCTIVLTRRFFFCQNQIEGAWFKHNAEESMFSSRLQGNGSKLLNSEGTSDYSCPWIPDVHEWCYALHIRVTLYLAYKKKQTIS